MPPSANGNSTSEPAAPKASNPTRRQLFNVGPCGRKIAARPTSAPAAAISASRISESAVGAVDRANRFDQAIAQRLFGSPPLLRARPFPHGSRRPQLGDSVLYRLRCGLHAWRRRRPRRGPSGRIRQRSTRGRGQLRSDFLVQALSERVKRALQPFVKLHQGGYLESTTQDVERVAVPVYRVNPNWYSGLYAIR